MMIRIEIETFGNITSFESIYYIFRLV